MHEWKRALWKDSLLFFHKALAYGMFTENLKRSLRRRP